MDNNKAPYYLGLDCGTSSVGFAVTDEHYNLMKAQHKDIWGSHLFDEASTAEERRIQRNARKRLNRRKERIKLLQSIFAEEIYKLDPTFFIRLNESALWVEDRDNCNKQRFSLFNEPNYTDKEFKRDYPTIFHLRKAIIEGNVPHDPRLVYLALHNILKNRGHFLFPGDNFAATQDISVILNDIKELFSFLYEDEEEEAEIFFSDSIAETLKIKKRSERLEQLKIDISSTNTKKRDLIAKAIVGYKIKPDVLFDNEEYKELPAIDFQKNSFEESDLPLLEASLDENEYKLVEALKVLFDWTLLANIMENEAYISFAKVKQFEKNKEDLALLKKVVKEYAPDKYKEFFFSATTKYFSSYIGSINTNRLKHSISVKRCNEEDFYKSVKDILKSADKEDEDVKKILDSIENDQFFVLLRSYRNGVIPYQVNKMEMQEILYKSESFMPWLNKKDEDGLTPKEKIISIIEYRIPYYVGPLVNPDKNKNAWLVRKEQGKILPWNFDKMVNEDASAKKFITRMTNKCTYCQGEDVVPKSSLLYQSFMVLNEINNLKFNGEDISVEQKQTIYKKLFMQGSVTQNKIKALAIAECWIRKGEPLNITGVDTTIKSKLSSYLAFKEYLDRGVLSQKDVEQIIKWLTIFSDGGKIVKRKIKEEFGSKLSNSDIEQISRMKFSGWGNLSSKFLTQIEAIDPYTGEFKNIIRLLWDTNYNLMEIIHNKDCAVLENLDNKAPINKLSYSILEELRVSPKVKRQIWQALKIVKEIEHVMGYKPSKVFVEMTREKQESKRTKSRKDELLEKIKETDKKEILEQLEKTDEQEISKRDKLYLYYTQLGKCMYSGEDIDLDDLLNGSKNFDIDHIYPFSKSSDDSLENRVIVKSSLNRKKTNVYPIQDNIRINMSSYWKMLLDKKLISSEKYRRLTRNTPFTDADTQGFINRQIVETSQSTLAITKILQRYFGSDTQIIFSKAKRVSEFRDIFDIPKSRSINDLHHAHDAYLNIVVGNTLHAKYTQNWFLKQPNFNDPYKYDVPNAWIANNNETIKTVKNTIARNSILFTRQPEMRTGQLFDLNPKAKGSEKGMLPLKMSEQLKKQLQDNEREDVFKAWTDKYGGYNSLAISHFALIKHKEKKKYVYSFIRIPVIRAEELSQKDHLIKHCIEELHLIEPQIIKTRILINTPVVIDGYKLSIANCMNGGKTLGLKSDIPLLLNDSEIYYVKKLEKYEKIKAKYKDYKINSQFDMITKEENENLYKTLSKKSCNALYAKRPANMSKLIKEGFSYFQKLDLETQTTTLLNLIDYFKMGSGLTNLSTIGGSKAQGTFTNGSKIDPSKKKVSLIFQSITGIYEEVLELK